MTDSNTNFIFWVSSNKEKKKLVKVQNIPMSYDWLLITVV